MTFEEALELLVAELGEQGGESQAATLADVLEQLPTTLAGMDEDHAAVLAVAPPLNQASGFHPVDDAGDACDGDVELLGESAHGHRAGGLQERKDVEVDEADRALMPLLKRGDELPRVPHRELVDDLANQGALRPL